MKYEEIWIKTKDNLRLQGWFMYQPDETTKRNTIVFLHENAGNIGLRMDWFEIVYKTLNVNIVAVAYRGFSRSEGHPTQEGLLLDSEAILEYTKSEEKINNDRVFLCGRSLGGAVNIHTMARLAEQKNEWIRGVILENTFTSISDMADKLFPFLTAIPNIKKRMLRLDWNSQEKIAKITRPILFVAGAIDKLCPMVMTKDLYQAAVSAKDKSLFIVPNGDHNDSFLRAGPEYTDKLQRFMNHCLGEVEEEEAQQIE